MVATNSFRNLSNADLQHVMLICEQLHHADPAESFVHHCHTTLNRALSNVHFAAEIYQVAPFELVEQELHTLGSDHWIPLFKEHIMDHPYVTRMFMQAQPELSMTHLEPTLQAFQQSTLYNEFYNQVEAQNQIWVGIKAGNQILNCTYSREKEYSMEQLSMMNMIQPHLELAWKNWKRTRSLHQELDILKSAVFQSEEEEADAAALRKRISTLTARQRDVVELVAAGKDNQQIAEELKISILTVKKHLQTVFQSMEIQHRTQLAAQWHQAYSVQVY